MIRPGQGYRHRKDASHSRFALGPHRTALALYNALGDAESEAHSSDISCWLCLYWVKALEDALKMLTRNTNTAIPHPRDKHVAIDMEGHRNDTARW